MRDTTAYCGPAPTPESLLSSWNLDPVLLFLLAGAGGVGVLVLLRQHAEIRRRQGFGLAMAALILAFVAPLCALTVALVSARTVHHLILLGVAAPALAVAFPLRQGLAGVAPLLLSAALWAWHLPVVYSAAWGNPAIYWVMQAAVLLPAWAFWSGVLRPRDAQGALGAALAVAALAVQMGLIGAILTFAPAPLYAEHLVLAEAFGVTALQDQQLAGLIMWVPGMLPLALIGGLIGRRAWRHGVAA